MNIIVRAAVESISTRADGSIKLVIGTPELNGEQCAKLFNFRRNEVVMMLASDSISHEQRDIIINESQSIINNESNVNSKSKAKQLRSILYRLWEYRCDDRSFNEYYNGIMGELIERYKTLLNDNANHK